MGEDLKLALKKDYSLQDVIKKPLPKFTPNHVNINRITKLIYKVHTNNIGFAPAKKRSEGWTLKPYSLIGSKVEIIP